MDNDNDVAVTATLARSERLHALAQLCIDRDSQLTVDGYTADKVVHEVISRVLARNWSREFSGISVVDGAAMYFEIAPSWVPSSFILSCAHTYALAGVLAVVDYIADALQYTGVPFDADSEEPGVCSGDPIGAAALRSSLDEMFVVLHLYFVVVHSDGELEASLRSTAANDVVRRPVRSLLIAVQLVEGQCRCGYLKGLPRAHDVAEAASAVLRSLYWEHSQRGLRSL